MAGLTKIQIKELENLYANYQPTVKHIENFFWSLCRTNEAELTEYQIRKAGWLISAHYRLPQDAPQLTEKESRVARESLINDLWLHNMIHWPEDKTGRDQIVANLKKWLEVIDEGKPDLPKTRSVVRDAMKRNAHKRPVTLKDVLSITTYHEGKFYSYPAWND